MSRRTAIVVAVVAGALAALLVAQQLALPAFAERRLRTDLEAYGTVLGVDVRATPAWKLLGHEADRVEVRMAGADADGGGLADALARSADTGELDASVAELRVGPQIRRLTLSGVRMRKRGQRLVLAASVTEEALRDVLLPGFDVEPVDAPPGEILLRGTIEVFGVEAGGSIRIHAEDGKLVAEPDLPFGAGRFAKATLFDDPRVRVDGVGAASRDGGGFTMTASGRVLPV